MEEFLKVPLEGAIIFLRAEALEFSDLNTIYVDFTHKSNYNYILILLIYYKTKSENLKTHNQFYQK